MDLPMQQAVIMNADPILPPITPSFVPAPKPSFPWLALIFSALLSITIVIGFYFFTQTQTLKKQLAVVPSVAPTPTASDIALAAADPTGGWQTYTDSIENISFKYPAKYTIEPQPIGGTGFNYQFAPDYLTNLAVLSKYSTIQTKQYEGNPSSGDIVIGDNTWKIYSLLKGPKGTVGEENPRYVLQSEINKHLVIFVLNNQTSITNEQKQILSTFRFTDQSSANPMADWQTYTNSLAQFTLKYPKSLSIRTDCIENAKCIESFLAIGKIMIYQFQNLDCENLKSASWSDPVTKSTIKIDGIDSLLISSDNLHFSDNQPYYLRAICVPLTNKSIKIQYNDLVSANSLDQFNQILSTFHFTTQ